MAANGGYPECMRELIEELAKMPGIGVRTAERLAFYVLTADKGNAEKLATSIRKVNESIRYCGKCFNLSEADLCSICSDNSRDPERVCVVEEPKDIISIERSGVFRGLYHVLLGALSPLDGVGPQDIKAQELIQRVKTQGIKEVILGTTSDTEGEATAIYLAKALKPFKIKTTRLAQGIPVGSDLEFADRATLIRSIEMRREI